MKQAVIFAVQIALIWINNPARASENPEKPLWIFHTSVNSQLYSSENSGESHSHQQHGQYSGLTFKPLSFAWFHSGLKSRWTQSASLSEIYSEPASLKFAAGLRVYKKLIYVTAGMALPLQENQIPERDTSAFSAILNEYSPLAEQNILALNSVHAGGYLNHSMGGLNGKLGVSYLRPSSYELLEGTPNFHSDLINYKLRLSWTTPWMQNLFEGKLTRYGDEKDRNIRDSPAHTEGSLSQIYYALKFHLGNNGLETGLGSALRGKDFNRTSDESGNYLEEEKKNSNIQRFYLNIVWVGAPWKNNPLMIGFAPQWLSRASTDDTGYQSQLHLNYKFKITQSNKVSFKTYFLYGSLGNESLTGGGVTLSLTFHGSKRAKVNLFPKRSETDTSEEE